MGLGQVWYLIVSITDLCTLTYIEETLLWITNWHQETYGVITNDDRKGWTFLSHPHIIIKIMYYFSGSSVNTAFYHSKVLLMLLSILRQ